MIFRPSTESNGFLLIDGERYDRHGGHGWVAESAQVDDTVFVDRTSIVHPGAIVEGNVRIEEGTEVGRNARISGELTISRTQVPEGMGLFGAYKIHKGKRLTAHLSTL